MRISKKWTTLERYAVVRKITEEMNDHPRHMSFYIIRGYTQRLRYLASGSAQFLEARRENILGENWRDWTHAEPTG